MNCQEGAAGYQIPTPSHFNSQYYYCHSCHPEKPLPGNREILGFPIRRHRQGVRGN